MKIFRFLTVFLLLLCLILGFFGSISADNAKEVKGEAKSVWSDIKSAAKSTGKTFKDGAVKVGRSTKKAAKKVLKGENKQAQK